MERRRKVTRMRTALLGTQWRGALLGMALASTAAIFGAVELAHAQEPHRPGLFFREDWAETPPALPVTQADVVNPELVLSLHGPGREGIKKSNHDQPYDDPFYIWSGEATGNWALSLSHRKQYVDLSRQGKIVWRSKQQGLRELRIVLKLADGTWLISDQSDGPASDWRIREFVVADIRWQKLNINDVVESGWAKSPNLSKVEAIGFTDLMRGGKSIACSRLDWIEVYGHPVAREGASKSE